MHAFPGGRGLCPEAIAVACFGLQARKGRIPGQRGLAPRSCRCLLSCLCIGSLDFSVVMRMA